MQTSNTELQQKIARQRKLLTPARRADIAIIFRARMVEKKLKNVDVAQRLGVSEANVSRWLRGDQNLSVDTLYAIGDALGEHLVLGLRDPNAREWQQDNAEKWTPSPESVRNVVDFCKYSELRFASGKPSFAKPMSEVINARNGDADERTAALG